MPFLRCQYLIYEVKRDESLRLIDEDDEKEVVRRIDVFCWFGECSVNEVVRCIDDFCWFDEGDVDEAFC